MTELEDYLSAPECATMAGIGPNTFTAYVNRGENQAPAPVGRVAGRRVWLRADVEAWVDGRRKRTKP